MIVADGVKLSTAGIAAGMAGALMLGRVLAGLRYGVSPLDPLTFAVVAVSLILAATLAAWVPARRATRISPVVALRN
jgi:putative ABC transport system permease protein